MEQENFDSLWLFCISNNRLIPKDWVKFYDHIANKKQLPSGAWEPSLPFILGSWHFTMPFEKQLRFKEQVRWACDNGQTNQISEYLRSLSEQEWYHFGEL
jgi:hypothetical protein